MHPSPFGNRLRAMREARGWTQGHTAKMAGISRPHLCNIEHGRQRPSSQLLDNLAAAFGLSRTELLKGLRYIHRRSHRHRLRNHAQGLRRAFGHRPLPTPEAKLDVICREATFYRLGPSLISRVIEDDGDYIVFHPQLTIQTQKGRTPRLDFLVSLSHGGRPCRADLEIDGPGRDEQQERDANRPEMVGMPVVRVQVEDLDRTDFAGWLIDRLKSAVGRV